MRAVLISRPGGPEVLEPGDVMRPEPGPHELLVRVRATAINRADLLQRRGHYPAPPGAPANIPGLEYAGVVEGSDRRVMGLVGGGSYAEYVVVHEDEAIEVPDALSFEQAAAVPEAFITAWDALWTRAGLQGGERVLIHAVASGVGTAAAQLAKRAGCHVTGTARSAWKLERIAHFVDRCIDTSRENFAHVVRDSGGADVIIDLVGGDYLAGNMLAINPRGRIVVVGLVAGRAATLDMGALLNKRVIVVGTVMRSRGLAEKIEVAQAFSRAVLPWLAAGDVTPVIDRVLPIEDAAEAHRIVERNENVGKVVLTL